MKQGINFSERTLIILSFLALYTIWGSTFLATYWTFTAFPPFFMLGVRFTLAGGLFLAINAAKLRVATKKQIQTAMGLGVLIIGIGTGAGMYSVKFLDTGISALMIGMQPLVIVLFLWLFYKEPPTKFKILGIIIGLLGLYLLVSQDEFSGSNDFWKGFIAVIVAVISWGIGSILIKQVELPKSNAVAAALQLLAGGLFASVVSLLVGEDYYQIPKDMNTKALFALIYLIIFGSIVGYSAYNYLLQRVHPAIVATTTYVNPIVAMLLGWALNNEVLSQQSILAAFVLLLGVFFISSDKKKYSK